MEEEEKPSINLKRYQKYQREIPWGLIRKLILFGILFWLMYYGFSNLEGNKEEFNIEVSE